MHVPVAAEFQKENNWISEDRKQKPKKTFIRLIYKYGNNWKRAGINSLPFIVCRQTFI